MRTCWRHGVKQHGDPDDQVFQWLTKGAPAGILHPSGDPGIFPETSTPSENRPEDLHCDEKTFRNYAGVEEQDITDAELSPTWRRATLSPSARTRSWPSLLTHRTPS